MNSILSQARKILSMLQERRGEWVPMPLLSAASGAYAVHSRVAELRRAGYEIDNRTETGPDGHTKFSFYRISL